MVETFIMKEKCEVCKFIAFYNNFIATVSNFIESFQLYHFYVVKVRIHGVKLNISLHGKV